MVPFLQQSTQGSSTGKKAASKFNPDRTGQFGYFQIDQVSFVLFSLLDPMQRRLRTSDCQFKTKIGLLLLSLFFLHCFLPCFKEKEKKSVCKGWKHKVASESKSVQVLALKYVCNTEIQFIEYCTGSHNKDKKILLSICRSSVLLTKQLHPPQRSGNIIKNWEEWYPGQCLQFLSRLESSHCSCYTYY